MAYSTWTGCVHWNGCTCIRTNITDAGLINLKNSHNLVSVTFWGAPVTNAGIAELQKLLPNCYFNKQTEEQDTTWPWNGRDRVAGSCRNSREFPAA